MKLKAIYIFCSFSSSRRLGWKDFYVGHADGCLLVKLIGVIG